MATQDISINNENRDPKSEADKVLSNLVCATGPQVNGAHDAHFIIVGKYAYLVAEVNDERGGEDPAWPSIYCTLSVIHLDTLEVKNRINFAKTEERFENIQLGVGACFVPRILKINNNTLRCFFSSEQPRRRQSQMFYRDFDIESQSFSSTIHKVKLTTATGTYDMQPKPFFEAGQQCGLKRGYYDYGLYIFDEFKTFDEQLYVVLNNFPGGQLALAKVNANRDSFEVIGFLPSETEHPLSEASVNKLPSGKWVAICRQDGGDCNYVSCESDNGRDWKLASAFNHIANGTNSKPTFDRFYFKYFLGWQESTKIDGVSRSVFNIDVSNNCLNWQNFFRFETPLSFQYPCFVIADGVVWVAVTQGKPHSKSEDRKERIMFGRLCDDFRSNVKLK